MSDDNGISTKLVGLGIPIGGLMGILASLVSEIDISTAFSFGVGGGIITAALMSTIIRNKKVRKSILHLISLGIGFGTLVGIALGLLMIWTSAEYHRIGFSIGAGVGLLGGALLGLFSAFFLER